MTTTHASMPEVAEDADGKGLMNVAIFGATGQLGRHVTEQALAAGAQVTAFTRHPDNLDIDHPELRCVAGEISAAEAVAAAVVGTDAVIVTIGSGKSRKNTVRSDCTRNVIDAMHRHGVKRLIVQTTLGCQETWENLNFLWKRVMFGALIRPVFLDHEVQEQLTQSSGLDWTIVRPSAFREEPTDDELRIGFPPSESGLKLTVAKSEVARFIVDQLEDRTFVNQAVSISR